ncbi:MAG: HAMP domain-containing protein, partial [Oscillospiraceae bacterium]|nr:HAMP domain-containing protein [Oscillospiraceae bacterium]
MLRRLRIPIYGIKRRWLINSLALSMAIVLMGVTGYSLATANYYYKTVQDSLVSRASATANFISKNVTAGYDGYYSAALQYARDFNENNILELQFINLSGRVEVSASRQTVGYVPRTGDISAALADGRMSTWIGVDPLTGEQVLSVSAPLFYRGLELIGVMRYVSSMKEVNRRIFMSMFSAILIGVLMIGFIIVTNLYFIRSIVTPIQDITRAAKKIATGSYGAKIEKVYNDEIGELANTINDMSTDIAGAERQKTDFISAISHELRTPLTAIAGWGEVLLNTDYSDIPEIHKGVRIMLKEARRLTKMVEELLDFSRMETGRMVMLMEPFDLAAELEEVVFMYISNLSGEGIKLHYDAPDEATEVQGDRGRLRQVFLNILDNAVKYGGDGKRIDVSLRRGAQDISVVIRDYGPGIAP